ncbi:MAG: helix-turn-helix domain-containing protein [Phenylobacterium sp.]|uniref:helix-turn-helix domain-containing protein n=1 Tax=Phenylobacterium sp. TaxID=1871053 RepID=UPI0011FF196B|nr:XRE family transcriptional regulator [Phenylobacterium sp.]TAJ69864.1 MAG: helix-turn-helix domain-containing protein [Phenylobacterium sp.]
MDAIVDDSSAKLARRILLEREARGWSLAELAEQSGVSKAAISKIERAEVSPTAVVLVRLAAAFDLTLAGLLVRAEGDAGRLARAADQAVWRDPDTGYVRRQIYSRPDHPQELVQVDLPPGRQVEFPASAYARIRQAIWVTAGELVVHEGATRHVLHAGDCLGFGDPAPVVIANQSTLPCSYVVALVRT